jgi:transketolase
MDENLKNILQKIASTIRGLSIEAIQKANSGHPGLPLGCAEIGAYLYAVTLKHYPKNPKWINRDRFILSAGHGSMLLYSCLHLAGFDLSLEDIKSFRKLFSKTPGHPEYEIETGIEATTGPLGQGIGNAVGMALAQKILREKFKASKYPLFDSKVFCLVGDGCMMEGVSSEVSSLAGHLNLDNLIVIYDSNGICLDGPVSETFSEDIKKRYLAYGWDVFEMDGYDFEKIDETISNVKKSQKKPVFIIAHTVIGKGSPHKAGSHKVHGSPLGEEEVRETKKSLELPEEKFHIPKEVKDFFERKLEEQKKVFDEWSDEFKKWGDENEKLLKEFEMMKSKEFSKEIEDEIKKIEIESPIAGRKASGVIINFLADKLPYLYGGSADLSCSDMTMMKSYDVISRSNFKGRNFKYGVREFAMGTITNGLSMFDMIVPFAGTFLVFSDYMRNSIRLAALAKLKVIYQFTHDSIFLGEDGPTHQPIEHLASLRAIPNIHVIRPADSFEVKMAWIAALRYDGPTAIVLSRQNLSDIESTKVLFEEGVGKGAYIVLKEEKKPNFTLFATGSELELALEVAKRLKELGRDVRVVSMPSFEIFEKQSEEYKDFIVGGDIGKRVSIEAGVDQGWYKYIGRDGVSISVKNFGKSGNIGDLKEEFGFTLDGILKRIL